MLQSPFLIWKQRKNERDNNFLMMKKTDEEKDKLVLPQGNCWIRSELALSLDFYVNFSTISNPPILLKKDFWVLMPVATVGIKWKKNDTV